MKWVILAAFGAAFAFALPAVAEPPRNFAVHEMPKPLPAITFTDRDGRPRSLDNFRGKVVLFNIWATWCLSCRKEMPTLDRLQAQLGGAEFEVVALSIDRGGSDVVSEFYGDIGVKHLSIYIDVSTKVGFALGLAGLPTTLLIDREGRELGRLIGPAEWDTPEIVAFLKSFLVQQTSPPTTTQQKEQRP